MYRGLAGRQQITDRLGMSRNAFNPASTTSNAEYGGWFGHSSPTRPGFARAKSEITWRNGATIPVNVEDTGILRLKSDSVIASQSNNLDSMTMNINLPGQITGNADGARGLQKKSTLQVHGKSLDIGLSDEQNSGTDMPIQPSENYPKQSLAAFEGRYTSPDQVFGSDGVSNTSRATKPAMQRSYNYQTTSPNAQLHSDQLQLRKSGTAIELLPDRTEQTNAPTIYQSVPHFKHGLNASGKRVSYAIPGTTPLWRSRWSQNCLLHTDPPNGQRRVADRRQLPSTGEDTYKLEASWAAKSADVSNRVAELTENSAGHVDDGTSNNNALGYQIRDRSVTLRPGSEKINATLESPTQMDIQTSPSRHKLNLHQNLNDENKQKFGRYGDVALLNGNVNANLSASQSKLGLQRNAQLAKGVSLGLAQVETQNKINIYSDLVSSNKSSPREARPTTATNTAFTDNRYSVRSDCVMVPRKSILKKPKVFSGDLENRLYARRVDMLTARHSAGPTLYFSGLSNYSNSVGDSDRSKQYDSHQKRVTFQLS